MKKTALVFAFLTVLMSSAATPAELDAYVAEFWQKHSVRPEVRQELLTLYRRAYPQDTELAAEYPPAVQSQLLRELIDKVCAEMHTYYAVAEREEPALRSALIRFIQKLREQQREVETKEDAAAKKEIHERKAKKLLMELTDFDAKDLARVWAEHRLDQSPSGKVAELNSALNQTMASFVQRARQLHLPPPLLAQVWHDGLRDMLNSEFEYDALTGFALAHNPALFAPIDGFASPWSLPEKRAPLLKSYFKAFGSNAIQIENQRRLALAQTQNPLLFAVALEMTTKNEANTVTGDQVKRALAYARADETVASPEVKELVAAAKPKFPLTAWGKYFREVEDPATEVDDIEALRTEYFKEMPASSGALNPEGFVAFFPKTPGTKNTAEDWFVRHFLGDEQLMNFAVKKWPHTRLPELASSLNEYLLAAPEAVQRTLVKLLLPLWIHLPPVCDLRKTLYAKVAEFRRPPLVDDPLKDAFSAAYSEWRFHIEFPSSDREFCENLKKGPSVLRTFSEQSPGVTDRVVLIAQSNLEFRPQMLGYLRNPALWPEKMHAQIQQAAEEIEALGERVVPRPFSPATSCHDVLAEEGE